MSALVDLEGKRGRSALLRGPPKWGVCLPTPETHCRTAAAVLGAQARRRLTAPGLPGAQGP